MSTVSSFSWEEAMEEASQSMPTTVSCIWAMMPLKKDGENNKLLLCQSVPSIHLCLILQKGVNSLFGCSLIK